MTENATRTDRRGGPRRPPLRVLVAAAASVGVAAAVAVPMAYRTDADPRPTVRDAQVMGTTVERDGVLADGLVWSETPAGPLDPLHGARLDGQVHLGLELRSVARVDFRLDDGEVRTDRTEPWRLDDGPTDVAALGEGAHHLTATVTFIDGRVALRRARFTVDRG